MPCIILNEIEPFYANNLNDASGRQRRPPVHLPGHMHTNRDCLLGNRLCQSPVPWGLHQGHRDDAMDQEDRQRVLGLKGPSKITMLNRLDTYFASKFCLNPNVVQTYIVLWMLHRLTPFCQTLP